MPLVVPPEAYELHMVFASQAGGQEGREAGREEAWDNNGGDNFYIR